MARPRKRPRTAAYERRDRRAREQGYDSYYDYRLHDNGRLPPGPLKLSPEERARRRGHRSRKDFLDSLREGDFIIMPFGLTSAVFNPGRRGGQGAYEEIVKLVVYARPVKERTFTLRNLTRAELVDLIGEEQRRGASFTPNPSQDQRRLVTAEESEGGY